MAVACKQQPSVMLKKRESYEMSTSAYLSILCQGTIKCFELTSDNEKMIGRNIEDSKLGIKIQSDIVSRQHGKFIFKDGTWY